MTTKAIAGEPCFAFELAGLAYDRPTQVPAWWWDQGSSGDCQTRTSDVVASQATIAARADSRYDLLLKVPLMGGGVDEIGVTVSMVDGALRGSALKLPDRLVVFTRVSAVLPSFAPVP